MADAHPIVFTAPAGAEGVSAQGAQFLWVAFAGLFLPAIYMYNAAMSQPDGRRYFHVVSALICAIASVAYLSMASGFGSVYIYGRDNQYRQFFYARYIDWLLTTPLQLLDLAGLAGASSETTFTLLTFDALMILCGLIGALVGGAYQASWYFWGMGMLAFLPIVYTLAVSLPDSAATPAAQAIYKKVATLTVVFWSAYPIVWVLAEGTSSISSDTETILYTFLDIVAKSVFGLLIVSARDGLDGALNKIVPDGAKVTGKEGRYQMVGGAGGDRQDDV